MGLEVCGKEGLAPDCSHASPHPHGPPPPVAPPAITTNSFAVVPSALEPIGRSGGRGAWQTQSDRWLCAECMCLMPLDTPPDMDPPYKIFFDLHEIIVIFDGKK